MAIFTSYHPLWFFALASDDDSALQKLQSKKLKKNDEIANEIDEILHLNLLEVQTSGSVLLDARSSISERSLTRNRFSANCDKNENLERDIFFH